MLEVSLGPRQGQRARGLQNGPLLIVDILNGAADRRVVHHHHPVQVFLTQPESLFTHALDGHTIRKSIDLAHGDALALTEGNGHGVRTGRLDSDNL